jgi:hypothetical protein
MHLGLKSFVGLVFVSAACGGSFSIDQVMSAPFASLCRFLLRSTYLKDLFRPTKRSPRYPPYSSAFV